MKKNDLKVYRDGCLKFITVFVVRVRMKDKQRTYDLMMYFDKQKADSICADVLSRNNKVEFCYVVERSVFL